ncbi:MAG: preprotein translocase subunit SecE [gamma proteobacterium symbiont of Bathyaustriella thionipta]|nr:preprotein translocase subunit SecE [gamma proteobacterium symbiont of Bathyaustriella thionipta]
MNAKAENASSSIDTVKLLLALLIVAAGIAGFYYFETHSTLLRVVGLLAVFGLAAAVALSSNPGRRSWQFVVAARAELRKVVWPSRQETIQTTLIVFIMVVIVALILWGFDSLLAYILRTLLG